MRNSSCLKIYILLPLVALISACGQECYTSQLQLAAKYERCQDLGISFSGRIGNSVHTYVCSTNNGDMYADFVVRDGKLCRTFQQD